MSEQEERREQELTSLEEITEESVEKVAEEEQAQAKVPNPQNRNTLLWVVCGGYLLYLAFGLIKGIIDGETSGTSGYVVSIAGGIIFGLVGIFLLYLSIRNAIRSFKASVVAMTEAEEAEAEAEQSYDEAAEDDDEGIGREDLEE